ncbi:MAG: hypothetical protein J5861_04490 [Desulfovibrio sp.]|nr:hypothetical protein [Desulfovibrio sp.]
MPQAMTYDTFEMFSMPELVVPDEFAGPVTHYKLDDGRLWSIAEAKFVSALPEGGVASVCPDSQGHSSLDGLRGCLGFYGHAKGELA